VGHARLRRPQSRSARMRGGAGAGCRRASRSLSGGGDGDRGDQSGSRDQLHRVPRGRPIPGRCRPGPTV